MSEETARPSISEASEPATAEQDQTPPTASKEQAAGSTHPDQPAADANAPVESGATETSARQQQSDAASADATPPSAGDGGDPSTPAGPSPSDPPRFRVQIGSLGNREAAREAKPAPSVDRPGPDVKVPDEDEANRQAEEKGAPSEPKKYPPPRLSRELTPELEREIQEALGDVSLAEALGTGGPGGASQQDLEPESKVTCRVVKVHGDDVLVELGGREQGVVSLMQFDEPPQPGESLELVVNRQNRDDGLYELSRPGQAIEVADWSDIQEGMVVQAVVTGHNKGGLECTVNNIRGFIPASQIEIFRVENFEQYVGQSFPAVVTEANSDRRNLIVSRRAVQEREKAEAREKMLEEISVGQVRDGVVRRVQDFGAFVDLGGVDGLVHVSQLSWDRVNHPSDVLSEGQKVRVKIVKYDKESGKIGLSLRDVGENPWANVESKYGVGEQVSGRVSKIMNFGAFVRLEPGVEGLIHISELAHGRVHRVTDVLSEGQEVDVQILSVDPDEQRISLSLRALEQKPTTEDKRQSREEELMQQVEEESAKSKVKKKHKGPLKGGIGQGSGGEQFGLKW